MSAGAVPFAIEALVPGLLDLALGEVVDVNPGVTFDIAWAPVRGATAVEVDSAQLTLAPVRQERSLGAFSPRKTGVGYRLDLPGGARLRRLTLSGLTSGERTISSRDDLVNRGLRLVVTAPDAAGNMLPRFAVPSIAATDFVPAQLAGASFSAGVLALPDLRADAVGLSLVEGAQPSEFTAAPMELGNVDVVAVQLATNLVVEGPDGSAIWEAPGEFLPREAAQTIDFRVALRGALQRLVAGGGAPRASIRVRGDAGQVALVAPVVRGALLRVFSGVTRASVQGEPVTLALPGPPLDAEAPASASADVTVRYLGMRLLEGAADAAPGRSEPVAGVIVGEAPVVRPLPPGSLAGRSLGAVGLICRAPGACEISVWPVDPRRAAGRAPEAVASAALSAPGVARIEASRALGVVWVPMPERSLGASVALAARANRGRLLWAAREAPLARVAVRDRDPGSRPLLVGGAAILALHDPGEPTLRQRALPLPAAAFAGAPPSLESELFLTVDFGDLTLRYAR